MQQCNSSKNGTLCPEPVFSHINIDGQKKWYCKKHFETVMNIARRTPGMDIKYNFQIVD